MCRMIYNNKNTFNVTDEYGLNTCFDILTHTVNSWGHEMKWKISGAKTNTSCESNTEYDNMQIYTQQCCLPAKETEFSLTCLDTFQDGWHGAYIEIEGKRYCENFHKGESFATVVPNPSKKECGTGTI